MVPLSGWMPASGMGLGGAGLGAAGPGAVELSAVAPNAVGQIVAGGLAPWAAVLGIALGLGLVLIASGLPRFTRPSLTERIAPFLVDVSAEAKAIADAARRAAGATSLRALAARAAGGLRGWLRPGESVSRRLVEAGSTWPAERFRAVQLLAGAAGGLAVAALTTLLAVARPVPSLAPLGLGIVAATSAFLAADSLLTRAAARRRARIAEEFPTVAAQIAMSLSAGEGAFDALARVAAACSGELGAELRRVVADTRVGVPLIAALERLRGRVEVPAVSRLVEAVAAAAERGAPLAETLRAQASDARAERRRELLEAAGRKEIAMLVPLVFLILPLTVLIAVFPGVYVLRAGL